ncbi:hypothetical protein N8D56_19780 [Devosia sp. A8/3-2]|nr:hypothetical protein N8D56_19780 [Devosia sp. A8/3-2]
MVVLSGYSRKDANQRNFLMASVLSDTIKRAAALRGQRDFKGAITLVDQAVANATADDDLKVIALLQGLYAADEAGLASEAKRFAVALIAEDPEIPSIQKYL